jgi:hypothetical protein
LSLWFHTDIRLKIITTDPPVVCKEAPHIHWVSPPEFEREQQQPGNDSIYLELPSPFHTPVVSKVPGRLPKGVGVRLAVFDFDWVHWVQSRHAQTVLLSPEEMHLENRMSDKKQWAELCVQPSWERLYQNRAQLHPIQKRVLVGLSRVLGEWRTVEEVSPQCEWPEPIVAYDRALVSYHTSVRLPPPERQALFVECLRKGGPDWIETWWELSDPSVLLQKLVQHNPPPWFEGVPVHRWVPRRLTNKTELYHKETMLLKALPPSYDRARKNYLFSQVLTLDDPSAHRLFTRECTHSLTRLKAIAGCEVGDLQASADDPDFVPSSAGLMVYPENPRWFLVNVRKVNYRILPNGTYTTLKNGQINPTYNGISKNEFYFMDRETLKPLSPTRPMGEGEVPGKREEELAIVGLEDVRLVPGINQDVQFYCVTKSYSYSDAIRIMTGRYDLERALFCDTRVIHPPYEENACEKNWTWCGHNRFLYKWHPVELGSVDANHRLVVDERLPSPAYFKEFRGSSPAVVWRDLHFFSVHSYTDGENGRKYIHFLVVLDLHSPQHRVVAVSLPFCFEDIQIEYSIGMDIFQGKVLFLYSTRDSTSRYVRFPLYHILDSLHFPDKEAETLFKTRVYQDLF